MAAARRSCGVGSAEEFVDEEESWGVFAGGEDGVEALDFGEEFGLAFGERVGEGERGADCEGVRA